MYKANIKNNIENIRSHKANLSVFLSSLFIFLFEKVVFFIVLCIFSCFLEIFFRSFLYFEILEFILSVFLIFSFFGLPRPRFIFVSSFVFLILNSFFGLPRHLFGVFFVFVGIKSIYQFKMCNSQTNICAI